MAVGDRVERAGIKGNSRHAARLARPVALARKVACHRKGQQRRRGSRSGLRHIFRERRNQNALSRVICHRTGRKGLRRKFRGQRCSGPFLRWRVRRVGGGRDHCIPATGSGERPASGQKSDLRRCCGLRIARLALLQHGCMRDETRNAGRARQVTGRGSPTAFSLRTRTRCVTAPSPKPVERAAELLGAALRRLAPDRARPWTRPRRCWMMSYCRGGAISPPATSFAAPFADAAMKGGRHSCLRLQQPAICMRLLAFRPSCIRASVCACICAGPALGERTRAIAVCTQAAARGDVAAIEARV